MGLIDITKFFIISLTEYDELIINLGLNLTHNDNTYLITYIGINLYAIFIIIIASLLISKLVKAIFRSPFYGLN